MSRRLGAAGLDHRGADVDVLAAEQPALAGMRVERGDRDARVGEAHVEQGSLGQVDGAPQQLRREQPGHVSRATWVVTWLTRMSPCASSVTELFVLVSAASMSV
jgi:hypothetical protein